MKRMKTTRLLTHVYQRRTFIIIDFVTHFMINLENIYLR